MDTINPPRQAPKEAVELPAAAWEQIVQRLNAQGSRQVAGARPGKRLTDRTRYTKIVRCVLRLRRPSGNPAVYTVRTRNLSSGGVGLFFNQFLHAGTHCHLALSTLGGQGVIVEGDVRWCRHIGKTLHECGVQFVNPIDLDLFLDVNTTPRDTDAPDFDDIVI